MILGTGRRRDARRPDGFQVSDVRIDADTNRPKTNKKGKNTFWWKYATYYVECEDDWEEENCYQRYGIWFSLDTARLFMNSDRSPFYLHAGGKSVPAHSREIIQKSMAANFSVFWIRCELDEFAFLQSEFLDRYLAEEAKGIRMSL